MEETSAPRFRDELEFTKEVQNLAKRYGWIDPFHIPAVAYRAASNAGNPIPAGFPDLVLRYRDTEGKSTVIVAELKTDEESSFLRRTQREFLEDFAPYVPAFVWRPSDWRFIERVLRDGPPDATGQIIEPSPLAVRIKEWLPPQRTAAAIIGKLVADISHPDFPRGDLAGLRRMNPEEPRTTAFYRLMGERGLLHNPSLESKWALIMHGIALMTPTAHDGRTAVGQALFEGGDPARSNAFYSELRLNRLLKARGSLLVTLMTQMFRMMKAAGQCFDWREMAAFILSEGIDEVKAEEMRHTISRSYYAAEYRNTRSATE